MCNADSEFPETRASLLLHVQAGDDTAWHQFVAIYEPIIYRIARKRGFQDADAQDITQRILVSILGAIKRWKKKDESVRFRHWLRRVARNAICNALTRGPKDRAVGGTSVHCFLEEQVDDDAEITREIELEYRRELYFKAAAIVKSNVSPDTWEVFELTVVQGVPIEEVALQLNKSVGSAYAARGRVMTRLRRLVEEMEKSQS